MALQEDVTIDIAAIGTTVTLYIVTLTQDAYGNSITSYDGGTTKTGVITCIRDQELIKSYGALDGTLFNIYFDYNVTIKEKDKIVFDSKYFLVLRIHEVWDVGIHVATKCILQKVVA